MFVVREVLNNLDPKDRAQLQIAFENDFSQEIPLADGTFIGVNVYNTMGIVIIEKVNKWLHGRRK